MIWGVAGAIVMHIIAILLLLEVLVVMVQQ